MTQALRPIEGWPSLMTTEMAARYLSISEEQLLQLASRFAIPTVEINSDLTRWRKMDLERLIKKLPLAENLSGKAHQPRLLRLEENQLASMADAIAARLASTNASTTRSKLVSIKDACAMLGLGRSTVYRMLGDGTLKSTKIGRRTLIHIETIQAVIGGA